MSSLLIGLYFQKPEIESNTLDLGQAYHFTFSFSFICVVLIAFFQIAYEALNMEN